MVAKTILHEATFVAKRIIKPIPIAIIDVSPIEPGIYPKNASIQVNFSFIPAIPLSAATPNAVAPLYPSGTILLSAKPAIQTLSPDICDG